MGESKQGKAFIQHEFDEAIVVHQAIVEAERILADSHPIKEAQTAIGRMMRDDRKSLNELQALGQKYGATGKVEEVAGAMQELSKSTNKSAQDAPSEAYEAHAVLLTMLRKQQDSSAAIGKIAKAMDEADVKTAAAKLEKQSKAEADELADLLAMLAVQLATEKGEAITAG
jgi:hypothetical protein